MVVGNMCTILNLIVLLSHNLIRHTTLNRIGIKTKTEINFKREDEEEEEIKNNIRNRRSHWSMA